MRDERLTDQEFLISEQQDPVRTIRVPENFVKGPVVPGTRYILVQLSERTFELQEVMPETNGAG